MVYRGHLTHFGHANIVKHCHRPFETVERMNAEILARLNSKVGPDDTLYLLGDVFWWRAQVDEASHWLRQVKAGRLIILNGNHDKGPIDKFPGLQRDRHDLLEITVEGQPIVLCHYAMRTWNRQRYGAWQLYGHSHGTLPDDPHQLSMDVGVDTNDFYPYSFEDVRTRMAEKLWKPPTQRDNDVAATAALQPRKEEQGPDLAG